MTHRAPNRRNKRVGILARAGTLIVFFLAFSPAHASTTSGTIDPSHKYAWSNVGGYANFAPAQGGITVTDAGLSGYAWSANDGWINFSPAQSGVKNDGQGHLSGFAWDSAAGWVSFAGVTIDSNGLFHGLATGGAGYALNFDCTSCSVQTDWRPASSRSNSSNGGGGGGSISPIGGGGGSFFTPIPTVPVIVPSTKPSTPSPITQPVTAPAKGTVVSGTGSLIGTSHQNLPTSIQKTVVPKTKPGISVATSTRKTATTTHRVVLSPVSAVQPTPLDVLSAVPDVVVSVVGSIFSFLKSLF